MDAKPATRSCSYSLRLTVGLLLVSTLPITISITIHGSAEFEHPKAFHLREKIQAASFICAISTYGRNQLMSNSGRDQWTKLETVPLGIDPELFVPHKDSLLEQAAFNIISVGSLTQAKAHHILIDAVSSLRMSGRKVRLRLVGEGPHRNALENQIVAYGLSDAVTIEGALNQDQLRTLYRRSDAFVLASLPRRSSGRSDGSDGDGNSLRCDSNHRHTRTHRPRS